MDSWYATREMMLYIESLKKIYDCPLKSNRLVNDSETHWGYHSVDTLEWDEAALKNGKLVSEASRVAKSLTKTISIKFLAEFIREIRLELDCPTQQVRDILDNAATEADCRIYLAAVASYMAEYAKLPLALSNNKFIFKLIQLVAKLKNVA